MTPTQHVTPVAGLLVIDSIIVTPSPSPAIALEGAVTGAVPARLVVRGSRQTLSTDITVDGSRWTATLPLLHSMWGRPALPPRSGPYVVIAQAADGSPLGIEVDTELPAPQLIEGLTRVSFDDLEDGLDVRFSAPLSDRERGPLQQAALEADYRSARFEPINAVFFESFYGQNASCNPRAIDRELARLRPDITRYWSVADASVEVPPGAVAL